MRTIWNPWHGCVKCSEGCANCYMYFLDRRRGLDGSVVRRNKSGFNYPVQKDRHRRYKIPSGLTLVTCLTSDFFLAEADQWRKDAWDIIRLRPDLHFWIITKRPERVMSCLPQDWGEKGWPNVSIAVTCENQRCADMRLRILLELPFRKKHISAEPLTGEMDIEKYLATGQIEAVYCGGENYDGARSCHYEWVKSLSDQCRRTNVRFSFFDTGMKFVKDGKLYLIKSAELRHSQAVKSKLSFSPNSHIEKDEIEKDEIGQDEIGQDEIGQDEIEKDEIGQDEIEKDEIGQDEIGQDEIGQDEDVEGGNIENDIYNALIV